MTCHGGAIEGYNNIGSVLGRGFRTNVSLQNQGSIFWTGDETFSDSNVDALPALTNVFICLFTCYICAGFFLSKTDGHIGCAHVPGSSHRPARCSHLSNQTPARRKQLVNNFSHKVTHSSFLQRQPGTFTIVAQKHYFRTTKSRHLICDCITNVGSL